MAVTEPIRAIVQTGYGTTDVHRVASAARPEPGPDDVLVRVHAAGIDRGTWHLMTGRPYLMRIMGFGFSAPKSPIPGRDVAGTVVATGANVTRFRVGDAVCGMGEGTFAEHVLVREDKLATKPERPSLEQAAVLGISGGTAAYRLMPHAGRVVSRVPLRDRSDWHSLCVHVPCVERRSRGRHASDDLLRLRRALRLVQGVVSCPGKSG